MPRCAPLLWYALIFASSCKSVNGKTVKDQIHRLEPGKNGEILTKVWDKAWWLPVKGWHATEFAILFLLLRRSGFTKKEALALVALGASLDEF